MVERISGEEGKILSKDEFQRALDELKASKALLDGGFYFKSVSSSYYAVYHAAKAALYVKGVVPQSHEGMERMFSLYYVKTKEIKVDIGRIIGRLMKLREEADYYTETVFNEKDAIEALESAETFVGNIQAVVKFE